MCNTNQEKRTTIVIEDDIKVNSMIIRWLKRAILKAETDRRTKEQEMWEARGKYERLEYECELAREKAKEAEQKYIASARKVENLTRKRGISLARRKELMRR